MNGNARTPQEPETPKKEENRWPWWAQFSLCLIVLGAACFLLTWVPMHAVAANTGSGNLALYSMMAVFIGIVAMTVSGVFIFMTFRIDRGTKREAETVAREKSEEVSERIANKKTEEVVMRVVKEQAEKIKESWMESMTRDIEDQKNKLQFYMNYIQESLDGKEKEFDKKVTELDRKVIEFELRSKQAENIVVRLENEKQVKINELNEIKNSGVKVLEQIRKESTDRLDELESSIAVSIRSTGENTATELRSTVEDVKTWLKSREKEARQQVTEVEEKVVAEVRKAEDEARQRIENTIKDIGDDTAIRMDKRVSQAVDEMVEAARLKINEANVEKLVDEKIQPFLERSTLARFFGSRRRAP